MPTRLLLIATALATMACSPDCSGDVPGHCEDGGVMLTFIDGDGRPVGFSGSITLRDASDCTACEPRVMRVDCTVARSCGVGCHCEPGALELATDAWRVSTVEVSLDSPDGGRAQGPLVLSQVQGGGDCCATRLEGTAILQ